MPRPLNCGVCGKQLTDSTSRMYGIGPDCRRGMTAEQLRAAIALTREQAKPGYIPPARPATLEARANNRDARAVVEAASGASVCEQHGGLAGACALCRQENELGYSVALIIEEERAKRRAARDAANEARHHQPVQLELT